MLQLNGFCLLTDLDPTDRGLVEFEGFTLFRPLAVDPLIFFHPTRLSQSHKRPKQPGPIQRKPAVSKKEARIHSLVLSQLTTHKLTFPKVFDTGTVHNFDVGRGGN